ncbi:MAG: phosphoglycerate dehydrogenase-like enzyme/predicted dehydrogenase [Candidatus Paceibacteria bacterium]|jgi:phosphoglycerate dehydrogenase-like enzyme/predicted dehydrogenase
MNKSHKIRLGVIGAGNMTRKKHLPALTLLCDEGLCTLDGICDLDLDLAEKTAINNNIPYFTQNASELIKREDIDAICIFGPADVHYKYGLEALRNGKHLFVEKPPAKNVAQLKDLWKTAKYKKLIAVAGFNRRFQKSISEIKKRIDKTSVLTGEAIFNKPSADQLALFGMNTWIGVSAIHALDTLCFVMGERPTAIWSIGNGKNTESPENFSAIIEWGNRYAVFSSNNSAGSRLEKYSFHGYGKSFDVEGAKLIVTNDSGETEEIKDDSEVANGIYQEFKTFLGSIISGEKPLHSLETSLATLHLVDLVEKRYRGPIDWSFIDEQKEDLNEYFPEIKKERFINFDRKPAVLVLNREVIKDTLSKLEENFDILYQENISKDNRNRIVAIITGGPGAIVPQEKYFKELSSLKVLCVVGSSVKNWGAEFAMEKNISILNTADVYADAVAEFIVMQALVGLRRASVSHDAIRRGGWGFSASSLSNKLKKNILKFARYYIPEKIKAPLRSLKSFLMTATSSKKTVNSVNKKMISQTLYGKTIGIIGFGEITKKTILFFKLFNCKILVNSEYLNEEEAKDLGVKKTTLGEVLLSDVVSLQRGLSKRTERSFGSREINTLRPGTVLINSARAGLVDNGALIKRLKKGDIFACLDVFDKEPLPANDELRKLPNVFLTSHIAGSIHHTKGLLEKSSKNLVDKLIKHLDGNIVSKIKNSEHFRNMT